MIEIVQTGQAGKTGLLFDMHRLRARVFKQKMNWDVHITPDNLEVDQFDLPNTVYLLALNKDKRVIGSWRLLPTNGPTMIRDIWPQYLQSLPMPCSSDVWEVSRFAVDPLVEDAQESAQERRQAVAEMFCALTELCITTGIKEIYTFYDDRIAKVIQRLNCQPHKTSKQIQIDGIPCQTSAFKTDANMLERLRTATTITQSLIQNIDLPPALSRTSTERR